MIERSIGFGQDDGLIGTVCLPDSGRGGAASIGCILFNAGVVPRIGPHRLNVRLARQLAGSGIASIRFDLAGQGDSAQPDGSHSFETQIMEDLRAAMDTLQSEAGVVQFVLFGFCSGGYQGYPLALIDERISGLLMFDAFLYPTGHARFNRYAMRIREQGLLRAVSAWGWRAVRAAGHRVATTLSGKAARLPHDAREFRGLPTKADFAAGLGKLLDRGVKVGLMYSGGGHENYNYDRQFADAFGKFGIVDRVSTKFFPDMGHLATGISSQAELLHEATCWIGELTSRCEQDGPTRRQGSLLAQSGGRKFGGAPTRVALDH